MKRATGVVADAMAWAARSARAPVCRAVVLGLLAGLLGACGTRAPAPAATVDEPALTPTRVSSGAAAYEQRLRDSAAAQERANRLAEAATSWEILTVIKPDSIEYRDHLRDVHRLANVALADKLGRAEAAQKKGDVETAAVQYLGALALDPTNGRAADGLRAVERERNRRTVLGKASRLTLTKRSIVESQAMAPSINVPPDSNDLEYATMLGKQGEYDDAIALLEARLAADKGDIAARLLLADLYARKADKRLSRDKPGAIAALEQSVRLDPSNASAALRLRQWKSGAVGVARAAAPPRAASSVRALTKPPTAASATARVAASVRAASGPSRSASAAAGASSAPLRSEGASRAASASNGGGASQRR